MMVHSHRLARWSCVWIAASLSLCAGCATDGGPSPFLLDSRFRRDIVRVATFVDKQNPWLNFDDPPRDVPGGVKMVIYLTGAENPMGVFGDGTFHVDMYLVRRDENKLAQPKHLRKWTYTAEQAYQFGFREKQRLGWGYQFRVNWGDIDVLDQEVMFIVSFERPDGGVVKGKRVYFKVPSKV